MAEAQRWWVRRGAVSADGHDQCDHRYFISELNIGWRFWSPAGRVETITDMQPESPAGDWWWRIWTDKTGPNWSWRRQRHDRVHALPGSHDADQAGAYLRFVDLPGKAHGSSPSMHVVPAFTHETIPNFTLTLAEARYLGPGEGWEVLDRPDGGDQVRTVYPTKAKARAALLRAAGRHAKVLGLPLREDDPDA